MKRIIFLVLVALTCCFETGRAFGRQDYVRLMQGAYEADGVTINERSMESVLNMLNSRINRDWDRGEHFYEQNGDRVLRTVYELPPVGQIESCFTFFERAFQQLPRNKRVRQEFRYFMNKLSEALCVKGHWLSRDIINASDEDFISYCQKYVSFWTRVSDDVRKTMMQAFFRDGSWWSSNVEQILRYLCPVLRDTVLRDNPYGYGYGHVAQVLEYQPDCFKDIPLNAAEAEKIKTIVRPQFKTVEEECREERERHEQARQNGQINPNNNNGDDYDDRYLRDYELNQKDIAELKRFWTRAAIALGVPVTVFTAYAIDIKLNKSRCWNWCGAKLTQLKEKIFGKKKPQEEPESDFSLESLVVPAAPAA